VICIAEKIKEALQAVINSFESGNIPEAIAYSTFPVPNIPSSKWSLLNRTLVFLSGTFDARDWKSVNRHVKKGARAIYILVPRFMHRENDKGEEEECLARFIARPVFRVDDTDCEPLDYQKIKLPEFPLIQKAKEWGISVKAVPGNYRYHGYFSRSRNEIGLATKEETAFFHELAHAAHQKVTGDNKNGQCWKQEIVAELTAAVLCRMVGKTSKYFGNNYRYVAHYAAKAKLSTTQACMKVIGDVERVLAMVLDSDMNQQASVDIQG
jgi:hypothetical protein